MEITIMQRLREYLEIKGIGRNKFEKLAGLSLGYITATKKSPSSEKLVKILNAATDLNKDWLLTGSGPMLRTPHRTEALPITDLRHARVPLVSQYAYAGYLSGYSDPEYIETLPTIDFTPNQEMTGNYLAFEVKGDSMDDGSKESYIEGELLICREVEPHLWRDSRLHYNKRDFVIVHSEGILVKRIIAHDVEAHTITIHSLNPLYPDRTLNLADVRQIFSVVESRIQRYR